MTDPESSPATGARRLGPAALVYSGVFVVAAVAGWLVTSPWPTSPIRAATCAVGAALVLAVQVFATADHGLRRHLLTAALVAWCGASLGWTVVRPLTELPSGASVRVWSVFHYYLGTEYFTELGYTELYQQALAADSEDLDNWSHVSRVRNLETYEVEDLDNPSRSSLWSDGRWQEFKEDLAVLEPYVSRRNWRSIFRDRGYNAPPSFTALRRVFDYDLSAKSLAAVGGLDTLALVAAFLVVGWAFGPLRALVCATWVALYFGNGNDRLIGQPFLYDYLAALLLAACAFKKERPAIGGVFLAYAAMMRVFPGVLVVAGVAWWCALYWRQVWTGSRPVLRLVGSFTATCAVLAVVGLGNGRGWDGWRDFLSNMSQHTDHHRVGERRVGLAHLLTVDWSDPPPADQGSEQRFASWEVQEGAWLVVAGGVGVLWLWATARSRLEVHDMIWSSLALLFCALVLSRYYWSSACLLMLIGPSARHGPPVGTGRLGGLGGLGPASMASALFAWCAVVWGYMAFEPEQLHQYLLANCLALVLVVGALSFLGLRVPRSLHRSAA